MSNDINLRQNEQHTIHMLKAQAQLYTISSRCAVISIFSVIVVAIVAVSRLICPNVSWLSDFSMLYGVAASILSLLLVMWQKDIKTKAAGIQQEIDTYVFKLPWDQYVCGPHPKNDIISKYSHKNNNPDSRYENWYNIKLDALPLNACRILGMGENIEFDSSVKSKFLRDGIILSLAAIILVTIGTYTNDVEAKDFWKYLVPMMPVILWLVNTLISIHSDKGNLNNMQDMFEGLWRRFKDGENICIEDFKSFQIIIYLHRKGAYKIPDFYFKLHHNKLETEYSRIIDEYLN